MERPKPDVATLCRQSLASYVAVQWPGFEQAPHHRLLIQKLEAVERGEIKRLAIAMPPRSGKSVLSSTYFPAWYLGHHPARHVLLGSYGQELAEDFSRRVRNLLADDLHGMIFPGCRLSPDVTAAHRFETTGRGGLYAVGRGGSATGRGADLAIIDDPLRDLGEANSEATIKELHEWFRSVVLTRLTPEGAVIVIATRWSDRDLLGELEGRDDWEFLVLPALSEGEGDALGRPEGDALWPTRFPRPVLDRIREEIGSAAWLSLYQQSPRTADGEVFKRGWWRFYSDPPSSPTRVVLALDPAFSTKTSADYSALQVWGQTTNSYCLLFACHERLDFPALRRRVESLAATWNATHVLIEASASGLALIPTLKAETRLPVYGVTVSTDKLTRVNAVLPLIESGRVFLPTTASWLSEFLDEVSRFPRAKHDDQVDALSLALEYLRAHQPSDRPQFTAVPMAQYHGTRLATGGYHEGKWYDDSEDYSREMDLRDELERIERNRWGGF